MTIYLVAQVGAEKPPDAFRSYVAARKLATNMVRTEGRVAIPGGQRGFLRVMGRCGGSGLPIVVDVQPVELR